MLHWLAGAYLALVIVSLALLLASKWIEATTAALFCLCLLAMLSIGFCIGLAMSVLLGR